MVVVHFALLSSKGTNSTKKIKRKRKHFHRSSFKMLKLFFLYLSEAMVFFTISNIERPDQASLLLFHSSPPIMSVWLDPLKTSMSIFFFYKIFPIPDSVCHFYTIKTDSSMHRDNSQLLLNTHYQVSDLWSPEK